MVCAPWALTKVHSHRPTSKAISFVTKLPSCFASVMEPSRCRQSLMVMDSVLHPFCFPFPGCFRWTQRLESVSGWASSQWNALLSHPHFCLGQVFLLLMGHVSLYGCSTVCELTPLLKDFWTAFTVSGLEQKLSLQPWTLVTFINSQNEANKGVYVFPCTPLSQLAFLVTSGLWWKEDIGKCDLTLLAFWPLRERPNSLGKPEGKRERGREREKERQRGERWQTHSLFNAVEAIAKCEGWILFCEGKKSAQSVETENSDLEVIESVGLCHASPFWNNCHKKK